ncbi:MAG: protein phosphatase 2C domain-containing protein, partial [Raoultibacter sp.]
MAHSSAQRARTRRPIATFGSRTDIGCLRDHNEDSLIVTPPLFVVADGMGGHAAGEVASEIAVTTMAEKAPRHADVEALGKAVEAANRAVILAAGQSKEREGMGTTVTSAILEGERLVIAQVGDSRAYLLHQGKLQQLTRDHSLMA